jgi:hypothetical protein
MMIPGMKTLLLFVTVYLTGPEVLTLLEFTKFLTLQKQSGGLLVSWGRATQSSGLVQDRRTTVILQA